MEFWMIGTKLVLLLYLAFYFVRVEIDHFALVILTFLGYFCVNITLYLFNQTIVKRILLVISIGISIVACLMVHPIFGISLPLSIVELASGFFEKKVPVLLLSIAPILYIQESFQPLYGLVAIFCFMLYSVTASFNKMLVKDEAQIDSMRKAMQKLTKHVNENTEYIRQSEYTFKLEERNRISQEIHDKIGHSMTGALFQMEAAKRLIETDPPKAAELLQNAINISKDGIENIRLTLKNMKPPTEQVGIHRLKLMIDDFNTKQPIKTVLTYEGNLGIISPIQWKIIHENVTEALTNAMKYSQATVVSIDLKVLNKLVRVEVKDNGAGTKTIKKGLGFIGMEERTAAINGKIIVDSTHGFSVTTLLPISI
ncbi:sensor histidine kinase [Neobacillus sp. MM2021_6]|uniref:sensor histidine kinase n=1 Tax=Bacillaceae TaxID=186817 RepID=UPI00140D8CBD|nr:MULTISPECIES: sensor histidine kinase [Bacillaceae]MBO0958738.1 sensor histidine kinase [Neobacillus sp. MM2021_6]NHC18168.1 sensor histidine kinase [Bacillus sp. MM2020_4]